ncbi:MAG: sporulation protein YtfJ [Oscillospiraceae bacterium]|nr:sporulation protein YtfJ [Oscillospiraceae bacterium]
MSEHPIQGLMSTAMQKIREMIDVNTIIGDPITTPDGTTIIPVSKVSFGFASGGSDLPAKVQKELFGGGSGAGITINPIAFLVVGGGDVKLLQLSDGNTGAVGKAVEMVPDVIDKFSELFSKKDKSSKKGKGQEPAAE